ncbi:MAG: hypothetical protein CVV42_01070, partial [Candidatus Riflebacteria bacterium HGW-Riflebacteria-2]
NNDFLRQVTQNIEQVIWLQDINTHQILYLSPNFEAVWGRSGQGMIDNPSSLLESVHPEDRVQVLVSKPRINHKPINQIYRIIRPDARIRWIFCRSFLIDDSNGRPYCHFHIAEDVTDQKKIEIALRKTLDRSREQFDLSHRMSLVRKPEAVLKTLMSAHEFQSAFRAALLFFDDVSKDKNHGVELSATWQSSQSLSPWTNEVVLYEEHLFLQLLQPNQIIVISNINEDPRLSPVIRKILQEAQINMFIAFPMIALGTWLGCLIVYFPEARQFDHIELRHIKILIDQTTITLFNLQLLEVEEESRHEAEKANNIKTEFLAMISHELRTPLTSIKGFATTLLADDVTWNSEEQHEFIQTILQDSNQVPYIYSVSLRASIRQTIVQHDSCHQLAHDSLQELTALYLVCEAHLILVELQCRAKQCFFQTLL